MKKQTHNSKVIIGLVVALLAIPCGIYGWLSMYFVGTLSSVYVPHAISVLASIAAIVLAGMGMTEIETHKDTQKGRGIGMSSIAISTLNFILLVVYYASY
jgi:hypothetical protein